MDACRKQKSPPLYPRTKKLKPSSEQGTCRDYIWGICTKEHCIFRHERDFESMKSILKFCHDFQNKSGCKRPGCSYIHTSKEEEILFLNTGKIPRVLEERYAAIATPVTEESVQKNILLMEEFLSQPPPPPPPTAASPVGAEQLSPARLPVALLSPPPPPPPPTEAPTTVPAPAPKYTMAPERAALTQLSQLLPSFDRTKPPPSLPPATNGPLKRPAEPINAGPSKARKADSKLLDICDSCVQRELRMELCRQEMEKMQCELGYKSMILEKRMDEYEKDRVLLRSIMSPELYQMLDEDLLESSPKSHLSQTFECLLGEQRNRNTNMFESTDVLEVDIFQSLCALLRTKSYAVDNTSSDLLQTVLKLMRTTSAAGASERASAADVRPSDVLAMEPRASSSAASAAMNGLHSFVNGQKGERAPSEAGPRYSHAGAAPPYGLPPAAAPAPPYLPYQPAAPPPARAFFPAAYPAAPSNMAPSTTSFSAATRMAAPHATPRANVPAAPTNTTASPQNFNQYLMGRFPPQLPYFSSYQ